MLPFSWRAAAVKLLLSKKPLLEELLSKKPLLKKEKPLPKRKQLLLSLLPHQLLHPLLHLLLLLFHRLRLYL